MNCWGNANPAPQYSSSGGTWGTLHYGGQTICNTTGTLWLRVKLYTVVGSGEHQHLVWQDERTKGLTVDWALGDSWPVACIGNTSTRWQMSLQATYNGLAYSPAVAWSNVHTLPCGSGD